MQRIEERWSKGFTIVEVMIVLAVTSLMFLIAVDATQGKLSSTSFSTGVNDLAATIQNTAEEVGDGLYDNTPSTCSVTGSGSSTTTDATTTGGSDVQGTDTSCVFLGKMIHFYQSSNSSPVNNYEIISLAAANCTLSGSCSPNAYNATGISGLTQQTSIPENLTVSHIDYDGGDTPTMAGPLNIAFVQSQGNTDGSGAQDPITLAYDKNAPTNGSAAYTNVQTIDRLARLTSASICITDGQHFANIDVGVDNSEDSLNPITVNVQQGLSSPC